MAISTYDVYLSKSGKIAREIISPLAASPCEAIRKLYISYVLYMSAARAAHPVIIPPMKNCDAHFRAVRCPQKNIPINAAPTKM